MGWRNKTPPPAPDPTPALDPAQARAALTAAVSRITLDGVAWKAWKFGDRAWQRDAWRLYDITGQLRFIANWIGGSVSRCRLYVAEVDEAGEVISEAEDPEVQALAGGPLGRGPAKDEALRLLGINLFVAGEAYIVAESEGNDDGTDRWWVASGRQIKRQGDVITIARSQLHGGGRLEYRDGEDLLLRTWTPHPADSDLADSPTRSAIPDLRELEAIRKREFAELDSRLSGAGLLPLPEGIDFPIPDDVQQTGVQGFAHTLMRAMATSLRDRSSAEAMVPIMFTVPGEYLDKIRPVHFWSDLSAQLIPMWEKAVKSLAQSLDVPPEVLIGIGTTNHWNAWSISDDAIDTQIKPVLSRIADALTIGYLRAALEDLGKDPDRYVYDFSTDPLTVRPNRSTDAVNFHERGLLSDKAAVEAGAWKVEDLPSDEERLRRLLEKAVVTTPSLLNDPTVRQIIGLPAAGPAITGTDDGGGGGPGELPPGEPERDPQSPPEEPTETAAVIRVDPLHVAASMAVRRALSVAGSRLVPHRQRDRWPNTPRYDLHTRVGALAPDRADDMLRGAWTDLPATAAELGVDAHELRSLLHSFCVELLTRGMAYDHRLLRDLLTADVVTTRLRPRTAA
ncbi:hypothetical protein [Micromonospora sp. WMMC273]|uniref:hypothetical protein n=1 Tax=Micromonospora sp. WMMC273 TaxID=3015157 RepID=UPI0022B68A48|nr:hypothetical protein [Micromonospora sp. WMMC273]MCZ7478911.1 hypothetical protein [Micromonospora sp. WMMC273]